MSSVLYKLSLLFPYSFRTLHYSGIPLNKFPVLTFHSRNVYVVKVPDHFFRTQKDPGVSPLIRLSPTPDFVNRCPFLLRPSRPVRVPGHYTYKCSRSFNWVPWTLLSVSPRLDLFVSVPTSIGSHYPVLLRSVSLDRSSHWFRFRFPRVVSSFDWVLCVSLI